MNQPRLLLYSFTKNGLILGLFLVLAQCSLGYHAIVSRDIDKNFESEPANTFMHHLHNGDLAKADSLLKQGFDVNFKGKRDFTPLFWALFQSNYEVYTFLIDRGADLNAVWVEPYISKYHYTAIDLVIRRLPDKFLKYALDHGLDPNQELYYNNKTLIFSTVNFGHITKMEMLVSYGAKMDFILSWDLQLLTDAMGARQYKLAYRMIELGADPLLKRDLEAPEWNESMPIYKRRTDSAVDYLGFTWKRYKQKKFFFHDKEQEKWFEKMYRKFVEMGYLDKDGEVIVKEQHLVKFPEREYKGEIKN